MNNVSLISLLGYKRCIEFPARGVNRVCAAKPGYSRAGKEPAVAALPQKVCFVPEAKLRVKWTDRRFIANSSARSLASALAPDGRPRRCELRRECAVKPRELTAHPNYRFRWRIRFPLTWVGEA